MSATSRVSGALLLALSTIAVPSAATPPSSVGLLLEGCPELSSPRIAKILSAELLTDVSGAVAADASTTVLVQCSTAGVSIAIRDRVTRKSVLRSVDLSPTQAIARERVLAVAVAELVRWSWAEHTFSQETEASSAERTPPLRTLPPPLLMQPPPDAELSRNERWRVRLALAAQGRDHQTRLSPMLGGGANVGVWRRQLGMQFDLIADASETAFAVADVSALSISTSVAVAVLILQPQLAMGAGARFGWTRLTGEPKTADYTADQTSGIWGGPMIFTLLALPIRYLAPELRVEAGYAPWQVIAAVGGEEATVGGAWAGLSLGLAFQP